MFKALTAGQLFDSLVIRVNGPNAWNEHFATDWHLTDPDEHHRTTLSNGALIHQTSPSGNSADLTLRLTVHAQPHRQPRRGPAGCGAHLRRRRRCPHSRKLPTITTLGVQQFYVSIATATETFHAM
ncbi:hypothetical protein FAF44_00135 [Nonomuraea sp. MG754425]|nr:hypothetical protein [Nonomuraea sp. MG754425]